MKSDIVADLRKKENWQKKSISHWECGKYTICAAKTGDVTKFAAWYRNKSLLYANTTAEAREECYNHYLKSNESALNGPNSIEKL